jgi:hypothetical protein
MDRCPVCDFDYLINGSDCPRCGTIVEEDGCYSYDADEVQEAFEEMKKREED